MRELYKLLENKKLKDLESVHCFPCWSKTWVKDPQLISANQSASSCLTKKHGRYTRKPKRTSALNNGWG